MRRHVRHVLAAAELNGDTKRLQALMEALPGSGADAVVLAGNLIGGDADAGVFAEVFKLLGSGGIPSFYVPGPADAPVGEYLREAYNAELVYPFLHGIHGTFAFGPGYVVFAGMGGEILDEATTPREEADVLRYPAWEVEYRLTVLKELKDYNKVFVFTTPPAHKGLGEAGSSILAELVKTYNPRLVVVGGPASGSGGVRSEKLGVSLVVLPGSLAKGEYALVDLDSGKVEPLSV